MEEEGKGKGTGDREGKREGARKGTGKGGDREGRGKPLPLTVALLARRPQAAVEAGGPAQAAGRDLAGWLLSLPQDVQVAEGGSRRPSERRPGSQSRFRLRPCRRLGRGPATALHSFTGRAGPGRAGCEERGGKGRHYSNGCLDQSESPQLSRCSQWDGKETRKKAVSRVR